MKYRFERIVERILISLLLLFIVFCMIQFAAHAEEVRAPRGVGDLQGREARAGEFHTPKYKIAIVDTGFIQALANTNVKLCVDGHYDFVLHKPGIDLSKTVEPHGTYIANIIAEGLKDVDYCILVFRVWNRADGIEELIDRTISAVQIAVKRKAVAVNYSLQGFAHSYKEFLELRKLAEKTTIFVAAGNDNQNLDAVCSSYPGCYAIPNIVLVGAISDSDPLSKTSYSNYGKSITVWKSGTYVDRENRIYERGTSFASPRALADFVHALSLQE